MSNDQPQFSIIGDVSVDLVLGTLSRWPEIGTEQLLPRSELRAGQRQTRRWPPAISG